MPYKNMSKLKQLLLDNTKTLKEKYFELTEKWTRNHFKTCVEQKTWNEEKWCEHYGLTPRLANPHTPSMQFLTFPKNFYNTKLGGMHHKRIVAIHKILQEGEDSFVSKELYKAQLHYEVSINKLTDRIGKKGLNEDLLKVIDGSVGININTTITDGTKIIRAFTIVAEGQIQRPHYRYLIK